MTRTLKRLFLFAGLLLIGFLPAPVCIAQEHTSVQVDPVNGIATVSIEEDLRGRFTSAEFRTINIFGDDSENGQWQDIQVTDDSFSLRGPGHYEISFRNPTNPFRTEIWRQRIYVPFGSLPVAAELAEAYIPIPVFNALEEYFPVSLQDITSAGEDTNQQVTVSRVLPLFPETVSAGDELRNYLAKNGHYDYQLRYPTADSYRNLHGDSTNIDVYFDASLERDSLYITYYYFYGFDPKVPGREDFAHVLDRESVTIRFQEEESGDYVPADVIYAGHLDIQIMEFNGCNNFINCGADDDTVPSEVLVDWQYGKTKIPWDQAIRVGRHPVIYIARGSHAVFPAVGNYTVRTFLVGELVEPAGGIGDEALVIPSYAQTLQRLDFDELPFLSFSGAWIEPLQIAGFDVPLRGFFPPFIRNPYSRWLDGVDKTSKGIPFETTFSYCLSNPSTSAECASVIEYFQSLRGFERYSVADFRLRTPDGEPADNAQITISFDRDPIDGAPFQTTAFGEYTFIWEPGRDVIYSIALPGYCPISGSLSDIQPGQVVTRDFVFETAVNGCDSVPTQPTGVTAVAVSATAIMIQWDAVDGAADFVVRRAADSAPIAAVGGTTFTDSGLQSTTEYCYQVAARSSAGTESEPSAAVCAITQAPADTIPPSAFALSAAAVSSSEIDLSWTESFDNISSVSYAIRRNGVQINLTNSRNYRDFGLDAETEYCYVIVASDAVGNSTASNEACLSTISAAIPGTPSLVSVSAAGSNILVEWSPAQSGPMPDLYRLFKDGSEVFAGNSEQYSDSAVEPGTRYCYRVRAEIAGVDPSSLSNELCAQVPSDIPVADLNIAVTHTTDSVAPRNETDLGLLRIGHYATTIVVTNGSGGTISGATLVATVPPNVETWKAETPSATCTTSTPTGGCASGAELRWDLPVLDPGRSFFATYYFYPLDGTPDLTSVESTARVFAPSLGEVSDSRPIIIREQPVGPQVAINTPQSTVLSGQEFRYRIRYSNRTLEAATTLTLTLPPGVEFIDATDSGVVSGGVVTWPLQMVGPGRHGAVEALVRVENGVLAGAILDAEAQFNTSSDQSSASNAIAVVDSQSLEIEIEVASDPAAEFDVFPVSLVVSNSGETPINEVRLDTVYVFRLTTGAVNPFSESLVEFNGNRGPSWLIGTLEPGERFVAGYYAQIGDARLMPDGSIQVADATVTSAGAGAVRAQAIARVTEGNPDFALHLDSSSSTVPAGQTYRYDLRYRGQSSSQADTLRLVLPDDVSPVSVPDGATLNGQVIEWVSPQANATENFSKSVQVLVGPDANAGQLLRAHATFGSVNGIAVSEDVVTVGSSPLEMSVIASRDPAVFRDGLAVTVTVTNRGAATERDIFLQAPGPNGMTIADFKQSMPRGNCITSTTNCGRGGLLEWLVGDLAPGESFTGTLATDLTSAAQYDAIFAKAVAFSANDVLGAEDSVVGWRTVPSGYQIAIQADADTAAPLDEIIYRLRYSVTGTEEADQMSVVLPANTTFLSATGNPSFNNSTVSWSDIRSAGTIGEEQVVVSVNANVADGEQIVSRASFGRSEDRALSDAITVADSTPDIGVSIRPSVDRAVAEGSTLTVDLVVTNESSGTLSGTIVEAMVPEFMSPEANALSDGGSCFKGDRPCEPMTRIEWNIGDLEPGGERTVSFSGVIQDTADPGDIMSILANARAADTSVVHSRYFLVVQ